MLKLLAATLFFVLSACGVGPKAKPVPVELEWPDAAPTRIEPTRVEDGTEHNNKSGNIERRNVEQCGSSNASDPSCAPKSGS